MTRARSAVLLVLLATTIVSARPGREGSAPPPPAAAEAGIGVYFSPDGGATGAIVAVVNAARRSLDVQAYLLTTKELAGPIAKAHERGVKVRVLMDKNNAGDSYSSATYFANAGVPVFVDGEHKEAHNKVMLVDGRIIITGSFNFTRAAEEANAENLLVMEGKPKLYAAYLKNFEAHLQHAKPYRPAKQSPQDGDTRR